MRFQIPQNLLLRLTVIAVLLLSTAMLQAASVTLAWDANTETDLAGYKVYYGLLSQNYNQILDVGDVLECTIEGLTPGETYYFCLTAYDQNGNESDYSAEIAIDVEDNDPPVITAATCQMLDLVRVVFNETVEKSSAEIASNYQIDNGIVVQRAERQSDRRTIFLYTTQHPNGEYSLTVSNVRDSAAVPNPIVPQTVDYSWAGNDETPPEVVTAKLYNYYLLAITFSEPVDGATATNVANYKIEPSVSISHIDMDESFEKVLISTGSHVPGQAYKVIVNNVRDSYNTILPDTTSYQWESGDITPPSVMSVEALSATSVRVEFSETLDRTSAQNIANYQINNAVTLSGAVLDASGTVVTLTTSAHAAGPYSLVVANVADNASPPNPMGSVTKSYTYTPPDVTAPQVVSHEFTGPNLVKVTFSEPVEASSAQTVQNYSISPFVAIQSATLNVAGTSVILVTANHTAGNFRLTLNNIQDRAATPNPLAVNTYVDYSYTPPDVTSPLLTNIVMHGADFIELTFSESLERNSAQTAANYQITPSLNILSATLVGDNLDHVYLQTANHLAGQGYVLTVNHVTDRADVPNAIAANTQKSYTYTVEDQTPPQLTGVSLHGTTFLTVHFSEPLDAASAQSIANYTITPFVQINQATLDASLQTVFINTADHLSNANYTLTVSGVKDKATPANVMGSGNVLPYVCQTQDNTPPAVVRAEIHGGQTVEVVFTEPVDPTTAKTLSNYQITPEVAIQQITMGTSQTEVFLQTAAHVRGTYTLTLSGIKDASAAGNIIQSGTQVGYTYVPADNLPPILVQASFINVNTVELLFNEPLNRSTAEDVANYAIDKSITIDKAILTNDGMRVYLQTSVHLPGTYTVTLNNITDGAATANTIAANTKGSYSYVTVDNTVPTVVSAYVSGGNRLFLNFSEALDAETANEAQNYTISGGIGVKSAVLTSSNNVVILETDVHAAGDYTVTVNGVCDASSAKNPIAAYTKVQYSWNPPDTQSPTLEAVEILGNSSLKLTFSEALAITEAQVVANYSIQPFVEVQNAVLAADLNVVWLTTAPHESGSFTVTVVNVKDRAVTPNIIGAGASKAYNYTPPDVVAPSLVTAALTSSPQMLTLTFDEPLSRISAETVANYSISPNIQVLQAYLMASQTTVVLETAQHQTNTTYTVTVQNLDDRAPIPNRMTTAVTKEYTYQPPDKTGPTLLSAKLRSASQLELLFDEELEKASAENPANFRIESGVEILSVTLDPQSMKLVNLVTTDHIPGLTYNVYAMNVRDRAPLPNAMASGQYKAYSLPNTGGSADATAPSIARIELISSTAMDVIFTEPVDKATAENKSNYAIEGLKVSSAVLDSQAVRVHLTTSTHQEGVDYQIQVQNIRDMAYNTMATAGSINYLIQSGMAVSNLNRTGYRLAGFASANTCYADRDYTFSQVPTLLSGSVQILTSNDDKTQSGDSFLSFDVSGESTVYVAFDQRVSQRPSWLSAWKVTGEQVVNSRAGVYTLLSLEVNAGRVTLGANSSTMDDNMYLAFVKPHAGSRAAVASLNKPSYRVERLAVGDAMYIDREYTLAYVPKVLEDLIWIQTSNDDKGETGDEFLRFNLDSPAAIYVALDANIDQLPTWLDAYDETILTITDSRGVDYDVYTKDFSAGDVTLGGNGGSLDDNMYLVLIAPKTEKSGEGSNQPGQFDMFQNYPNPFNPTTTIRFLIQKPGHVKLTVFNVLGQKVRVLVDEEMDAGVTHDILWDGQDSRGVSVASGMYFYRLEQGSFAKTNRMILMR